MASNSDDLDLNTPDMQRLLSVMSTIETGDFERFEPPADLWDRISASMASTRTPGMVVEYWIDADDIVSNFGDGWTEFAQNNDAPELIGALPDRTLWSYFDGDEVRGLWQALVGRVRAQHAEATVPLRCDAPDVRRWFEMTITPGDNDTVRFRSSLLFEEPRESVAFLDTHAERDTSATAIALCSCCGLVRDGAEWVGIDELLRSRRLLEATVVPPIAHGICGTCREVMSAELLAPAAPGETPS